MTILFYILFYVPFNYYVCSFVSGTDKLEYDSTPRILDSLEMMVYVVYGTVWERLAVSFPAVISQKTTEGPLRSISLLGVMDG